MRDFTKYDIWIDGIEFAIQIYDLTSNFPEHEKFGLVSQIRRAAVSISSNFAEGCGRSSEKEFVRFIEISLGSAFEVKTQIIISKRLKFLEENKFDQLIRDVEKLSKQLNSLRKKIKE